MIPHQNEFKGSGFCQIYGSTSATVMGIPKDNFEIGLNQTRMDTVRWLIKKCEDYSRGTIFELHSSYGIF